MARTCIVRRDAGDRSWPAAGSDAPTPGTATAATEPVLRRANVLLVTIDTLRADRVGAYGSRAGLTPTLDRLAGEGVRMRSGLRARAAHPAVAHGADDRRAAVHQRRPRQRLVPLRRTAADAGGGAQGRRLPHRRRSSPRSCSTPASGLNAGFDEYDDRNGSRSAGGDLAVLERRADAVVDAALRWIGPSRAVRRRRGSPGCISTIRTTRTTRPSRYKTRLAGDAYGGEVAFADAQLGRALAGARRARPARSHAGRRHRRSRRVPGRASGADARPLRLRGDDPGAAGVLGAGSAAAGGGPPARPARRRRCRRCSIWSASPPVPGDGRSLCARRARAGRRGSRRLPRGAQRQPDAALGAAHRRSSPARRSSSTCRRPSSTTWPPTPARPATCTRRRPDAARDDRPAALRTARPRPAGGAVGGGRRHRAPPALARLRGHAGGPDRRRPPTTPTTIPRRWSHFTTALDDALAAVKAGRTADAERLLKAGHRRRGPISRWPTIGWRSSIATPAGCAWRLPRWKRPRAPAMPTPRRWRRSAATCRRPAISSARPRCSRRRDR